MEIISVEKERCTKQHVQTAAMNAKSLSSQQKAGQYIVETATRSTENQDQGSKFLSKI